MGEADIHCAVWCGAHLVSQAGIRTAFGIFYGDFWQKWVCAQTERPFVSTDVFHEKADGINGEMLPPAGRFCNPKEASDGYCEKVSSGKMRVRIDAQCLQKMEDKFY